MERSHFKPGDRVRIKPSSEYSHQSKKVGTVEDEPDSEGWYMVEFDGGYRNGYKFEDLVLDSEYTPDESDRVEYGKSIKFNVKGTIYEYVVTHHHLEYHETSNATIFKVLDINDRKEEFCSKAYGYEAEFGAFPECEYDDYEALTNVVKALHDECNKVNFKYKYGQ